MLLTAFSCLQFSNTNSNTKLKFLYYISITPSKQRAHGPHLIHVSEKLWGKLLLYGTLELIFPCNQDASLNLIYLGMR